MHRSPSYAIIKFLSLGIFVTSFQPCVLAQLSCECPSAGECAPCTGGFTSLTLRYLRYTGSTPAMVIASDNDGIRFEQNVLPSQMVTFSGSKKNEKFSGTHVKILVNGVLDAMLGTFCNDLIIGDQYGSFAAVTGGSKSGSKVCCVQTETDKTLPVITNCPATLFANTLDGCHASVRWTPPSFSDNCSISEVVSSHASGDTFAVGSTEVTYTATDNAGNTVSCSF
jgi:hypothetical protein